MIDGTADRSEPLPSRPRYDRIDLVLTVKSAAESVPQFVARQARARVPSRVVQGALAKGQGTVAQIGQRNVRPLRYTALPVADLRKDLLDRIYVFVQNPIGWTEGEPDAEAVSVLRCLRRCHRQAASTLSTRRVPTDRHRSGASLRREARRLHLPSCPHHRNDIRSQPRPYPMSHRPPSESFLRDVVEVVQGAADEADVERS